MKILNVVTYLLIAGFYLAVLLNSKEIIKTLKECVYLFVNTDWEEE